MRHMAVGLNQDTSLTGMILSSMVGSWIHLKGRVNIVSCIVILAQRDNIIMTITIYIGEVRSSTARGIQKSKAFYI